MQMKKLTIEDKTRVEKLLKGCDYNTLEYNFTTMFIWRDIFNTKIADNDEALIISSGKDDKMSFLYPYANDIKKALEDIMEYCKKNSYTPHFHSLSPKMKEQLEMLYPGKFEFSYVRDAGDYIYETESLMTLKGKKLSSKRNHINRFEAENPEWTYEKIDEGNIDEVYEMNLKWCSLQDCENNKSLEEEACAVKQAFTHFFSLGLDGGLIRTNGEIVAFSMGDRLNDEIYLVHIEKAFASVNGAYPMINKQFVLNNCTSYKYVDREDDAGDEGLRKAKLSYKPAIIAQKYNAKYIGE